MNTVSTKREVFLQHYQTQKFLRNDGSWTDDSTQARDFETTLNAVTHALTIHLGGAQILLRFPGTERGEVIVPISCDAPEEE